MNIPIVFLFSFVCFSKIRLNDAHCMDIHQHIVSQGLHYVPGPNPCTLCVCEKSSPKWCKQVLCSPPQVITEYKPLRNCKSFEVGNSCCEFKCLDDILSKSDNYSETYDLALRLIASAVTAVLSLSLLFFLIHRLRQRKIRLRRQNRQLSEDQRSLNSIGYITGSLGYLPSSIGYLGSANNEIEFHYDESNVHYPLWKPPGNYFPRGEAPPPYEEAVRAARSEAEMANNHSQLSTTSAPFTFSSNRNENVSLTLVHNTHVSITPNMQQNGVASSQCNVMLHQSNNVQSVQTETNNTSVNTNSNARTDSSVDQHSHSNAPQNANVSLACDSNGANHDYVIDSSSNFLPNTTVESQVDVHYENYNNTTASAPVLTVSVKNEESFPKTLNADYVRERVNRNTYSDKQLEAKPESANSLSCSSSWRKETVQQNCSKSVADIKQKIIDKNKNYKVTDLSTNVNAPCSSKTYRSENHLESKVKKPITATKEISRVNKPITGRIYDKQRPENKVLKCHNGEHKEGLILESNKHRTIPQKFSKTMDSELCYVNTSDFGKRKDDDFSEHCDLILKQHNIDKIRYAAEKLDKRNSDRSLNASIRNSLCAPVELRNSQRSTSTGLFKGEMSSHRTLPKNLRELSETFYLNFDNSAADEVNLDCLVKKTLPRTGVQHSETPFFCPEKILKVESNASNTLGKKHASQKSNSTNTNYRNSSLNTNPVESVPLKSFTDTSESLQVDRERNCVSYRCSSPVQDDVDDYRSECENCKSLSFEDCNDEDGDILNETMTLQRRPMEQGEEHSFYRTSLTLPSHTKKTTRSVTLNTPRETWFKQEMTSSSESD